MPSKPHKYAVSQAKLCWTLWGCYDTQRAVRRGDSVHQRVADDGIIQRFAARQDGQNLAKTIRVMMNGKNEP